MKKILFIATLFLSINSFGQKPTGKAQGLRITNQEIASKNDTIINVVYKNEIENNKKPAYFVNGKLINESILRSLNPNEIETVNVEKENIEIENIKYYGKLYIVTKPTYKPKFISLNNLKLKYTNLKDNSTIFQIDNEIIYANYESYIVDENYILKIIVEKFENKKEKLNVNFIRLITKSEENIKKSKEILIRGNNNFASNK
ncbi:hypothetical protein SAMN05444143_11316 [Flavobacterium succinicans]|uniref:Uncharacterized protein n=1 Tax=Flavobacterium succinicans TaxID=29536 RepID=A0A1I4YYA1_9FLAO|nr:MULTISPECIES: hypothetical protein [Flavobacterium]OOV29861.1 hypothetical protein BXU11_08360 [Flavobacterium sp. LM5]SFN42958.1 hypothetical protein SAMN05444143_11316 [Flavobacterium succinicans]